MPSFTNFVLEKLLCQRLQPRAFFLCRRVEFRRENTSCTHRGAIAVNRPNSFHDPSQLDLKNALRFDVALGGPRTDWATPATFAVTAPPAFRAKVGRTVVLALTNRAGIATVFHLHGHHFRLLDRLDDGWKPFWLDTLAVEPLQTQRIAFSAEHAGRWLIEATATDWAAPRLVRWYSVE
jgi:FtsP/CotA-like multicopper oxidase with cupredoxin domain